MNFKPYVDQKKIEKEKTILKDAVFQSSKYTSDVTLNYFFENIGSKLET